MTTGQSDSSSPELSINPALEPLDVLQGEWEMILSNASFLEDPSVTFEAPASIRWVQHGAFLLLRQGGEGDLSSAHWMIGRDESGADYTVLYRDGRGVSRVYQMSFAGNQWRKWRAAPGFHQRFSAELSEDGDTITGRWEASEDGQDWQHDFDLTYRRRMTK